MPNSPPKPAVLRRARSSKEVMQSPLAGADSSPKTESFSEPSVEGWSKAELFAERRERRASKEVITLAMLTGDPRKLEAALRTGLEVGLPDEVLERGLACMLTLDAAEAEAEKTRAREASEEEERLQAEREAEWKRNHPPKLPSEGSLVTLNGLSDGVGPFGMGDIHLAKFNGCIGRVVKEPPRHLLQTAYSSANEYVGQEPMVCVHTGVRASSRDQRWGEWLAVPCHAVQEQLM